MKKKLFLLLTMFTLLTNTCFATDLEVAENVIEEVKLEDSDSDGLPDVYEIYKYKTNPNKKDTDGDGIEDSDWEERREYVYSLEVKLKLYKPFEVEDTLFQDLKSIDEEFIGERFDYLDTEISNGDYRIVTVILYPYSDIDKFLEDNKNIKLNNNLEPLDTIVAKDFNVNQNSTLDISDLKKITYKLREDVLVNDASEKTVSIEDIIDEKGKINKNLANYYNYKQEDIEYYMNNKVMYKNKEWANECSNYAMTQQYVLKSLGIDSKITYSIPMFEYYKKGLSYQKDLIKEIKNKDIRDAILKTPVASISSHQMNTVKINNIDITFDYKNIHKPIKDYGLWLTIESADNIYELTNINTIGRMAALARSISDVGTKNTYLLLDIKERESKH